MDPERPRILRQLWRFGRAHRAPLAQGLLATLVVVLLRLAIPWPLRGVLEVAFPGGSQRGESVVRLLPEWGSPVLLLFAAYLACAVGGGLFEMVQRLGMVRFVSRTIQDLRARALWSAARRFRGVGSAAGELISRLVADAGRARSDLTGILVHVTKDGLLFLAVAGLFIFWISPLMGCFFLVGGMLASVIGVITSKPIEAVARRARQREGNLAATIQRTLEHGHLTEVAAEIEDAGGDESRSTRIQSLGSLAVHAVLGVAVCLALWTGLGEVHANALAPGELFLFIAYALMVHRRLVHVGRQLSRLGKVRASIARLLGLLDGAEVARATASELESGVKLERLRVAAARGSRPRLDVDLEIPVGARVALLGRPGDGKSTLLRCLAGAELPNEGGVRWDGNERAALDGTLAASVGYLAQDAVFARAPLWRLLGLSGPDGADPEQLQLLQRTGAWKVIRRLPKGLSQKLDSASLSQNQARALALGAVLLGQAPLLAIDSPCTGLKRRAAARRLHTILARSAGRTLVVAMTELRDPNRFDLVLVLRRGRVAFYGSPAEWQAWKAASRNQEPALCKA